MDINLIAPINELGYGVVGSNILQSLNAAGHSVALWPIGGKINWPGSPEFKQVAENAVKKAELYNSSAPSIRIWHQFELDMFPGSGPRIAWPIFELDTFNERELHHLRNVDHIFVCSEWAKKVLKDNEIDVPSTVVPLGIDPSIFYLDDAARKERPYWTKDTTIFINIGKWEKRKGHDELIAAFTAAFSPGDNVELWMINSNPFINTGNIVWKKKYANTPMCGHIKFFPRFEGHHHLRKIFNHVDCGIFPSHAEGWNLEIPELMACGAHIIATNYSGHTEFINEDNASLLDVTGMEPADDGMWFHGQGNWCTYDMTQLVTHMRMLHERKQDKTLGLNTAGIKTAERFTWANSVKIIEQTLSAPAV